jgi:hypothetical protein
MGVFPSPALFMVRDVGRTRRKASSNTNPRPWLDRLRRGVSVAMSCLAEPIQPMHMREMMSNRRFTDARCTVHGGRRVGQGKWRRGDVLDSIWKRTE